MDTKIYSKIEGALSGVAMGDAFGMPCEMWSRKRIKETYGCIRITSYNVCYTKLLRAIVMCAGNET